MTEKQRRRETERARERRRKMTGEALLEWRRRHAENARRRRAAMLQERLKIEERVKKTLSLQQYPKVMEVRMSQTLICLADDLSPHPDTKTWAAHQVN